MTRQALPPKKKPRILLLQGPPGSFFKHLQGYLNQQGFDCWRVSFDAGDRVFAGRHKRLDFAGTANEWEVWLSAFLATAAIDWIVLFGAGRRVHVIARRLAGDAGVRVLSLEEGYIRPGFVTIEESGNNASSPLSGRLPPANFDPGETVKPEDYRGYWAMCLHNATYYSARYFFSLPRQRVLFHRRSSWGAEVFFWARSCWRYLVGRAVNFHTIERLLEHHDRRYFLVPLQVPADSQLGRPAKGWTNTRLIREALQSFAWHAPDDARLVFKIHPLRRGHSNDRTVIRPMAKQLGIADRVDVIDTGSIGLLTRHSAGMITINSTSGLSAIHHGVPLMVIGDALYAHPRLAICARGTPDFDTFWTGDSVANVELRHRYLAWIRRECLKPGDFHATKGILRACEGVVEKLRETCAAAPLFEAKRASC